MIYNLLKFKRSWIALLVCVISVMSPSVYAAKLQYPNLSPIDLPKASGGNFDSSFIYQSSKLSSGGTSFSLKQSEGIGELSYGMANDLSVKFSIPYVVGQDVTMNGVTSSTGSGAFSNLTAGIKYKAYGDCCNDELTLVIGFDAVGDMAADTILAQRANSFSPSIYLGSRLGGGIHDGIYGGYKFTFFDLVSTTIHTIETGYSKQFTEKAALAGRLQYIHSKNEIPFWTPSVMKASYDSIGGSLEVAYRIGTSDWFLTPRASYSSYLAGSRSNLTAGIGVMVAFGPNGRR